MKLWIASILSRISRIRCAGFLERINGFAEDRVAEERFQGLPIYHVCQPPQQLDDIESEAGVLKQPDGSSRIQLHQHVNVAASASFSSGNRAKHSNMPHPARLMIDPNAMAM